MKNQVLHIVSALKASGDSAAAATNNNKGSNGKDGKQQQQQQHVSKEQRALLAREQAQRRIDLVNSLTALVGVYTDCVLAYAKAFQELAISVERVSRGGLDNGVYNGKYFTMTIVASNSVCSLQTFQFQRVGMFSSFLPCRAMRARWRSLVLWDLGNRKLPIWR